MTNCKMCGAKESKDNQLWTYDEIGKGDWDTNEHKTFLANQPMCEDCVKKMFPNKK